MSLPNPSTPIDHDDMYSAQLKSFTTHLQQSQRIFAVLGAGLSASSGLPTFRGAGGFWRTYNAMDLATPEAFEADPGLVWQFYSYRRHMALNAKPNPAHYALAELAKRKPEFMTATQNVDGLSQRAGHPPHQLKALHGSLFDVKCEDEQCDYIRRNDFTDPIMPALALPDGDDALSKQTKSDLGEDRDRAGDMVTQTSPLIKGADIAKAGIPLQSVERSSLLRCPKCQKGLLRPGVVWFGEELPPDILLDIDTFLQSEAPGVAITRSHPSRSTIDLCLVVGTSSTVFPAAGYAAEARACGARVAVINTDAADANHLEPGDWFFQGDAAQILPQILKPVIWRD